MVPNTEMQRTIYFLAVPQVYNAISVIYDGLAYGEREVIIQRGNTHNLAGGEGQVRLMGSATVWRDGSSAMGNLEQGRRVHGKQVL